MELSDLNRAGSVAMHYCNQSEKYLELAVSDGKIELNTAFLNKS